MILPPQMPNYGINPYARSSSSVNPTDKHEYTDANTVFPLFVYLIQIRFKTKFSAFTLYFLLELHYNFELIPKATHDLEL